MSEIIKKLAPNVKPSSPTFNIVNQYAPNVYHADLYRIGDESELENIGFREILEGDNLVFIEWPNKAPKLLESVKGMKINVTIENPFN